MDDPVPTLHTEQADAAFIRGPLAALPGWMNEASAAATCVLLRTQDAISHTGHFVEIGVYGGKYLSLLTRHGAQHGAKVLGLDPFVHFTPAQVEENIYRCLPSLTLKQTLHMQQGFSQEFTGDDLRRLLGDTNRLSGGVARLIHIDGSHDGDDVLWDLEISEPLLTPSGLLVVDDFFSPHDAGVTEALFRFQILRPRPLVPIAYVCNKVFLCRHSYAANFREALEAFLVEDPIFPESARFRERLDINRRMVETRLFGHPYLVVT